MRSEKLLALRKLVESCFGKKVLSHKECLELQNDILHNTETLLSINTLRRFFGLIKNDHSPSLTTLNILSLYCGYPSFNELPEGNDHGTEKDNSPLLQYMVSLFRDVPVTSANDRTFENLVKISVRFIDVHPALAMPFQQAIAKTTNGQLYYFESFVNFDKLDFYYGDGLMYYLKEKQVPEAQIFGNSLLALRCWLTADNERFLHFSQKALAIEHRATNNSSVSGWHFGIRVLQANHQKKAADTILLEARECCEHLPSTSQICRSSFGFELTLSALLILAEEWQEALFYAEKAVGKLRKQVAHINHADLLQTLYLFQARALAHLGNKKKSITLLASLDTNRLTYFGKRFNTILYLLTEEKLNISYNGLQLQHLITQTHFYHLSSVSTSAYQYNYEPVVPHFRGFSKAI